MKRGGPLKRKTPLRAKTGLKPGKPLERLTRLRPISEKQRQKKGIARVQAAQEAEGFKRATVARRCVVCRRSAAEARQETGYGHQAHHVISKSRLRRIGRLDLLWSPANATAICEEPCHRQHTSGKRRVTRADFGPQWWGRLVAWASDEGILDVLEREVPI